MDQMWRLSLAIVMLGGLLLTAPSNVYASLRAGCVGSDDIGVPGAVGWTDADLLFQLGPASPPHELVVQSPHGDSKTFLDGLGLELPTEVLPFWLAVVPENGEYTLIVDGYDCVVEASGVPDEDVISEVTELHPAIVFRLDFKPMSGSGRDGQSR